MHNEEWIAPLLEELRAADCERRTRVLPAAGGRLPHADGEILSFAGNDYLALARHPRVLERAAQALAAWGAGATSARLLAGTLPCHEELEQRLAAAKGYPAALLFGSGYLTNAGIIPALVGREDTVFADRLVHASIVDGIALSRVKLHRFRHNDPAHLEELLRKRPAGGRCLVITESVFSMDGDLAPLPELVRVAEAHDALILVDEAHATGIFGPAGSGCIRAEGLSARVNLSMGTLSKALGSSGGYVACSAEMHALLLNRARTFIFTTAAPPAVIGAALGALEVLQEEPDLGTSLLAQSAFFRARLQAAGLQTGPSASQIVPVMVGDPRRTLELAHRLAERRILAAAIRPPTVPPGTARLRLSVTLAHSRDDLTYAADQIIACARETGVL
jgi:glycine C-acetyltransferase/8-amino-7-oxononanoate synthase